MTIQTRKCDKCDGKGYIIVESYNGINEQGTYYEDIVVTCSNCNGTGMIRTNIIQYHGSRKLNYE